MSQLIEYRTGHSTDRIGCLGVSVLGLGEKVGSTGSPIVWAPPMSRSFVRDVARASSLDSI